MIEIHVAGRTDATNVIWPILTFGLWLDGLRGNGNG